MDSVGRVVSLVDARSGRNCIAAGQGTARLVSLMADGQQAMPSSLMTLSGNTLLTGRRWPR